VNGQLTYPGTGRAEGLLFNVRTVNATFDDTLGRVDWWDDDGSLAGNDHAGYGEWSSPESAYANTQRFVDALPAYRERGILAVNVGFQGGHPLNGKPWIVEGHGSAGARPNGHRDFYHNSGFRGDGSIDPHHAARLRSVIEACDRLGMVVILQLFYFGQDTVFAEEGPIRRAVDAAVDWVCASGYRNVTIEVANEVMQGHYHHEILKPARVGELIHRACARARDRHGRQMLVTTSEAAMLNDRQWTTGQLDAVFSMCDVVVIHGGDDVETGRVGDASDLVRKVEWIRSRPWYQAEPRPILSNEAHGSACFEALLDRGVSFGLHSTLFQTMFPPKWGVWRNETSWFFHRVSQVTGKKPRESTN
jgi:hypothetical protein